MIEKLLFLSYATSLLITVNGLILLALQMCMAMGLMTLPIFQAVISWLMNTLNLLLTDFPGIFYATVSQPVGTSDHNSGLVNVTADFHMPNYSKSMKNSIKSRINWDMMASKLNLINWHNIHADECLVSSFNSEFNNLINW